MKPIIVDSSVWIEYFKDITEVVSIIEKGIMKNKIFITGPIVAELLQGTKTEKEYNKLEECIDGIPLLKGGISCWKMAGKISFALRREGITIPLTDIFIAAVAINHDMQVYTHDEHFKQIPGVELYKIGAS